MVKTRFIQSPRKNLKIFLGRKILSNNMKARSDFQLSTNRTSLRLARVVKVKGNFRQEGEGNWQWGNFYSYQCHN